MRGHRCRPRDFKPAFAGSHQAPIADDQQLSVLPAVCRNEASTGPGSFHSTPRRTPVRNTGRSAPACPMGGRFPRKRRRREATPAPGRWRDRPSAHRRESPASPRRASCDREAAIPRMAGDDRVELAERRQCAARLRSTFRHVRSVPVGALEQSWRQVPSAPTPVLPARIVRLSPPDFAASTAPAAWVSSQPASCARTVAIVSGANSSKMPSARPARSATSSARRRGEARLGKQRADTLAARRSAALTRVSDNTAEAGEHLQFEELRVVEPDAAGHLAQAPASALCRRRG